MLLYLKLIVLAIVFVITSGAVFSESCRKNKKLAFLASLIAMISSYYLFKSIGSDFVSADAEKDRKILNEITDKLKAIEDKQSEIGDLDFKVNGDDEYNRKQVELTLEKLNDIENKIKRIDEKQSTYKEQAKLKARREIPYSDTGRKEPLMLIVDADKSWQNTGIYVSVGDRLEISANGRWTNGGANPQYVGPDGFGGTFRGSILESSRFASLIGKIGSKVFFVGSSMSIRSDVSGDLQLCMNDNSVIKDNVGYLTVNILNNQ